MKTKIEKSYCDVCPKNKLYPLNKIYKLTYRYNDKEKTYTNSKVKIIHNGFFYFCKKHLTEKLKI